MKNRIRAHLRNFGASALLLGGLAACGGDAGEAGVLPEGAPQGEIAALEYDAAGGRLLKAYPQALYASADGGATWKPIPLPASVRQGRLSAVAAADSGRVLYAAGPGVGVLQSTDGGKTWIPRSGELPSRDVGAFAVHADQPRTLYASFADEGIYRSEDAGETWTRMDSGPGAPILQFLHSDMEGSMQSGWLFAATPEGVRRSMDCFCGWRPTGELPEGEIFDVAYDPTQPKRVYASTVEGLFRSTDGGESWERVSAEPILPALAVDAAGTLYAADREGAVLRSADQGSSWERLRA
ncbi:MAG TPA: YCF48-related protein [Longimicrobiaceae bacterium]|nr:YCF48-related protein [Longimicrobiaceae bacterium]